MQFDNAVFIPYIHSDPSNVNDFNLFQGYKQKYIYNKLYKELYIIKTKQIKSIFNHIKNILCNKNIKFYEYFLSWLAYTLQDQNKVCVLVGFLSEEGDGKSMFFDWFREHVYGLKYTHEVTDLNAIYGRFNSRRENKVFTVLNEVQENQSKKLNNQLNAVITDKFFSIERKGIEAYEAMCQSAFIALSNDFFMSKL